MVKTVQMFFSPTMLDQYLTLSHRHCLCEVRLLLNTVLIIEQRLNKRKMFLASLFKPHPCISFVSFTSN